MSKVADLKNALTELFRKGTEVGYTETEIDEFLEGIDYHTLLQAVWDSAETVYAFRADGRHELSLNYRGAELFQQRIAAWQENTPTQEEVEQAASSIYNAASSIWGAIQDAASQQNDAA